MADDINLLPPDGRTRPAQERDTRPPSDADTKLHVPVFQPQEKDRAPRSSGAVSADTNARNAVNDKPLLSLLDQKIEPVVIASAPKPVSARRLFPAVTTLTPSQKWLLVGGLLLTALLAGLTVYLFWSL